MRFHVRNIEVNEIHIPSSLTLLPILSVQSAVAGTIKKHVDLHVFKVNKTERV